MSVVYGIAPALSAGLEQGADLSPYLRAKPRRYLLRKQPHPGFVRGVHEPEHEVADPRGDVGLRSASAPGRACR